MAADRADAGDSRTRHLAHGSAGARNVKHQTALSVAYGAGLRASEVIGLKITDLLREVIGPLESMPPA